MKRSPLKRSKPLKTGGALKRSAIAKRATAEAKDLTEARKVVHDRSVGRCELRLVGCSGLMNATHHRLLRRHQDHRPQALLGLCTPCHLHVHTHVADSYANGWLVHSWEDPALIPALLEGSLRLL